MQRVVVACLGAMLAGPALEAQQLTMKVSGSEVLAVSTSQMLIVKNEGSEVVVDGVVADGVASVKVERGDRIVRIQGGAVASVDELMSAYRAAAVGAPIVMALRRGVSMHEVRFNRPAAAPGTTRAVMAVGSAGSAGAWTSNAGGGGGFALLGAEITENSEGLPEVMNRVAHPLAASLSLRVGDVVAELNGHPIVALDGLRKWYAEVPAGGQVTLKAVRGPETLTFTFTKPGS